MFNDLLFRLRSLFRRDTVESEADAELRFHFDQQVEKYIKSGLTREEAIRRARLDFGGHEQLKEEIRDARGVNLIETLFQDIRYGLRILGRTPVISCVAILSLALGIGANTAIFSLIDTVMLRMLPVEKPEELMQVRIQDPRSPNDEAEPTFTNPLWEELRNRQDFFSGIFSWSLTQFDLSQGGAVHDVNGIFCKRRLLLDAGCPPCRRTLDHSRRRQARLPRRCGIELWFLAGSFWRSAERGRQHAFSRQSHLQHDRRERAGLLRLGGGQQV